MWVSSVNLDKDMQSKSGTQKIIMHIDMDAFFASVEKALNPVLQNKAVIVIGAQTRSVVACPSYEARALGVHTAMPVYQAKGIAPNATFIHGNFGKYRTFSEAFFEILYNYSELIEPRSLDEAYIDVSHLVTSMKAAHALAKEIQNTIQKQLHLSVSIGIASNKVCAKVASDLRKPGGITIVHPGQEKCFLSELPVEYLPGIGKRTKEILNQLNIFHIEQIANMPEKLLIEAFGRTGSAIRAFASGEDFRNVEKPEESKSVSRSKTLEEDTLNTHLIHAEVFRLLEECSLQLRQEKRNCDTVAVTVRFSDFYTISKQKKLNFTSNIEKELWPTTTTLLQKAMHIHKPIRMLGVTLENLYKTSQISLFDYPFSKVKNIQQAIDKIRKYFGFEAIQTGRTFQKV